MESEYFFQKEIIGLFHKPVLVRALTAQLRVNIRQVPRQMLEIAID